MTAPTIRLVGFAGLAQILLAYVPVAFLPPAPSLASSAAEVAHYYQANREAVLLVGWLGAMGLVPSFFFTAGLIGMMRRAEGPTGWLWLVFTVAVMPAYATLTLAFVVGALLPYESAAVPPETLKVFSDLAAFALAFYGVALIGAYLALASLVFTTRFLPRWLGLLACTVIAFGVAGCVGLLTQAGPYGGGYISLGAIMVEGLFVLAASVLFVVRPGSVSAPASSTDLS